MFPDWSSSNFEKFFNFSMSFRLDAEIRHGYGELVQVSPHPVRGHNLTEIILQFGLDNTHLAQKLPGKEDTLCCQFVSNCNTKSKRKAFFSFKKFYYWKFFFEVLNYSDSPMINDDWRLTKVCREKVVSQLSEFLNVDVFGKCGSHRCSRNNQDLCYSDMNKTYKFYLSFENSLCQVSLLFCLAA